MTRTSTPRLLYIYAPRCLYSRARNSRSNSNACESNAHARICNIMHAHIYIYIYIYIYIERYIYMLLFQGTYRARGSARGIRNHYIN